MSSEKAKELAERYFDSAGFQHVLAEGVDAAVAPLVEALKKNAATVRKYADGEDVHTYEATFALTEAMRALEGWKK